MARVSSAEGTLTWLPLMEHRQLVAPPVAAAAGTVPHARVASIDAGLADTAAFCAAYDVAPEKSANCVLIAGSRAGETRYAAVMVLATDRADVNGVIRKELDVRKCSFAPADDAAGLTGMEFGGITPVGLPAGWPILVDAAVVAAGTVVIGAGVRGAKLLVAGATLAALPGARVLSLTR
jgi:prolyl-tRNA editing enzyme YbaK/EbsC (Cys-tRNA(Pro) deacylase)